LYSRPASSASGGHEASERARSPLSLSSEIQHAAAERVADGLHEPLQELLSDHAGGACRHGAQEVLARRVDGLGHLSGV